MKSEMSLFEKNLFEKSSFWSKTQHTNFKIYSPLIVMYFENRKWLVVKNGFFMVLCIHFRFCFFGYIFLMVCDEVTFCIFQKTKMLKSKLEALSKRLFPFLASILSACIITNSLIHEATTLMEKLFQFWERHLSVQIAYLIKKGF